jgi:hypothetical protein
MYPLVERAGKRCVCDHHVEARDTVNAREQVPICREKAVFVGGTITNRYDDMAPRPNCSIPQKSPPQKVFVYARRLLTETFERAKCCHQELRLPHEPLGSAVIGSARLEHAERQAFECVQRLQVAVKRVVEVEHGSNQSGTEPERRLGTRVTRHSARGSHQHLALRRGEHDGRLGQSLGKREM